MSYDILAVVVDNKSDYAINAQIFSKLLSGRYSHNETRIILIFVGTTIYRAISGQKISSLKFPQFQDGIGENDIKFISLWIEDAKQNSISDNPKIALIVDVDKDHNQYLGLISATDGDILFYDKQNKTFSQSRDKKSKIKKTVLVVFSDIVANGSKKASTDKLILTFDKDIVGLDISDISINELNIIKETLNKGNL